MKGLFLLAPVGCLAGFVAPDPSDIISPSLWAADNAIAPEQNIPFAQSQTIPVVAENTYREPTNVDHKTLSAAANDTSVIAVSQTNFNASYVTVVKSGYSSSLSASNFYGLNAAINVANASRANIDHINITAHNGASGLYAYGTGTVINVRDAWLYSSGPAGSGLYATGNATIIGRNVKQFSGGIRSPAFSGGIRPSNLSGSPPAGDIYVYNSISHTQGAGSATFNALGTIYADTVVSFAEKGPVVFADGAQSVTLIHSDCKAGLLGGVAFYSSQDRQTDAASLTLTDTRITAVGSSTPGLWFGNTVATVNIQSSDIRTESGVLVVANYSQISPDLTQYAGYSENSRLSPASVSVVVSESTLRGDIVAYNGSSISWSLTKHSSWTGSAVSGPGGANFQVNLDSTSTWSLTRESTVHTLIAQDYTLSNIHSNGHTLRYNSTKNSWLGARTIKLTGGGIAQPM